MEPAPSREKMKIKAISIREPWASFIIYGFSGLLKTIETRNWLTSYRGILVIHASKSMDIEAYNHFENIMPRKEGKIICQPLGAIIGYCDLIDVKTYNNTESFNDDYLNHWCLGYAKTGWVLKNPRPLPSPVFYRGMPGLFNVDTHAVHHQLYRNAVLGKDNQDIPLTSKK